MTELAYTTAFLDSFQKVADMATTTRGGTKEIGTALTRLCLRQRSVEAKLKSFASAFLDCLIIEGDKDGLLVTIKRNASSI